MAEPRGSFRLLRAGPGRYLCYCPPGPGPGATVYVTDALEVWAGELGACPPLSCGTRGPGAVALSLGEGKATLQLPGGEPCSALELYKLPVAEAKRQLQTLVLGMAERMESLERRLEEVEALASSCSPEKNAARSQHQFLPEGPGPAWCPRGCTVLGAEPVARLLPGSGGGEALLLCQARAHGSSVAHQLLWERTPGLALPYPEDPSPRKNKNPGSALLVKRKIPGESLINPGFKSKKAPSGVDFEDS
ncbi:protein PAXX isoform X1 [Colius striatus]|uniref:protein PAXX isoform X1 n=1 Tax=Colius striatus TaxID=57412 RepID=UPI002B1E1B75|nr:protein PAXX isoform X1 [Colius striatus]